MITKQFTPKRTVCKVTFSLPKEKASSSVVVVGDFNNWDQSANPLKLKNDTWMTLVRFKPNVETKFKYVIDGEIWENDEAADGYVANEHGTEDSMLIVGE